MKGDKIKYYDGYKYQLAEDYTCNIRIKPAAHIEAQYTSLTTGGLLTIRQGYAWNGASGPTMDTKSSMRAALVHDALYQLIRQGYLDMGLRKEADAEFAAICKEDGMWAWRAWYWKAGVNLFGKSSAEWKSEPQIQEAP